MDCGAAWSDRADAGGEGRLDAWRREKTLTRVKAGDGRSDSRPGELVVHADAQDVVGDVRAEARDQRAAARRHDRRDERARHGAEIDIQVLDLGAPSSGDDAFEAGADGP